jgi:hypothetical protein
MAAIKKLGQFHSATGLRQTRFIADIEPAITRLNGLGASNLILRARFFLRPIQFASASAF